MKRRKMLQLCLTGLLVWAAGVGLADEDSASTPVLSPQALAKKMAAVRVPFIENKGQIANDDVQFYAQTFAGTLFVTKENQLVYSLPQENHKNTGAVWAFRESFAGRQPTRPRGERKSPVRVSYYKGNDPHAWLKQVPAFDGVALGELYPGVSVSLKAAGNNVEKLFYVLPGAAPDAIKIDVNGVRSISINAQRQLVLDTALGNIVFTAPSAYQVIDGKRLAVDVAYTLVDGGYGFKVGAYEKNHELVIDPLLASTYIGGHNPNPPGNYDDDIVYGLVATADAVYIAGATQSPDFPVEMGYDENLDSAYPDGFITQLTGDLSSVQASTYIGTQYFDRVQDIALDDDGLIVAVGQAGYGFPVTDGAYTWSGTSPVGGGFIAKFSADLANLVASAVVTPFDYPLQVAPGNDGIYFGGRTNNPDFPITPNAYLSTCCPAGGFGIREYDGFAGKMSSDLRILEALTYLGGDSVSGIAVAPDDGTVFISDGSDNAITGYLARFDADLTRRLAYLSYYPGSTSGSSRTYFNDVAVGEGFVATAGQTYMNDLPATDGAFDTTCGTDGVCDGVGSLLVPKPDGFVAKYSLDLQTTLALTYLGGSEAESCRSIALDADGDVYVAGETVSPNFPTSAGGDDTSCGTDGQCNPSGTYGTPAADGFVVKLSPGLSQLLYGSFIGGSGEDRPNVIAVNDAGRLYAAGYTRSPDFPTTAAAFDRTYNGGTSDAFVSLFDAAGDGSGGGGGGTPPANEAPVADAGSDQTVGSRQRVYLDGKGSGDADGQIVRYQWTQAAGVAVSIKNANSAVANFTAPRLRRGATITLVFELEVTDNLNATATDQATIFVAR